MSERRDAPGGEPIRTEPREDRARAPALLGEITTGTDSAAVLQRYAALLLRAGGLAMMTPRGNA